MSSPDIDQTSHEAAAATGESENGQGDVSLPRGAHAPMAIGQVGSAASGQPQPVDGVASVDADPTETREWLDSLRYVINSRGGDRAAYLLHAI